MPSVLLVPVDHDAETPLWRQLADLLRVQIQSGELQAGRVMPSETTLMQEHDLARGTVRKAIDVLVDEGLVNRVQGRGTFVRGDRPGR
jgi:DNA-binding GntR family transcriptional regulator